MWNTQLPTGQASRAIHIATDDARKTRTLIPSDLHRLHVFMHVCTCVRACTYIYRACERVGHWHLPSPTPACSDPYRCRTPLSDPDPHRYQQVSTPPSLPRLPVQRSPIATTISNRYSDLHRFVRRAEASFCLQARAKLLQSTLAAFVMASRSLATSNALVVNSVISSAV